MRVGLRRHSPSASDSHAPAEREGSRQESATAPRHRGASVPAHQRATTVPLHGSNAPRCAPAATSAVAAWVDPPALHWSDGAFYGDGSCEVTQP